MNSIAINLIQTIESADQLLSGIEEVKSRYKSAPDKWSYREIIGHLIDSAYNNRVRFMNAQFKNDMIFEGYDQDGWVQFVNYQEIPFSEILKKWSEMNSEFADLIAKIPEPRLMQKKEVHNLDKIAFQKVHQGMAVSLNYFITDYINHMRHHLNAIFPGRFELLPNSI